MVKFVPVLARVLADPENQLLLESDPDIATSVEAATWPTTNGSPAALSVRDGMRARPFRDAEFPGGHAVRRRSRPPGGASSLTF